MVPTWDGNVEEWETYTVRAGIYCRGVEAWKVGTRIANLIQNLTDKAWEAVFNLSEAERENLQSNLQNYLAFLKQQCLPTAIPELGRRFREWQKFRRLRKESMRIYVRRYRLQLNRLETSMRQVDDGETTLRKLQKAIKLHKQSMTLESFLRASSKGSKSSSSLRSVRTPNQTKKPMPKSAQTPVTPKTSQTPRTPKTPKTPTSPKSPKPPYRNWTSRNAPVGKKKRDGKRNGGERKRKRRKNRILKMTAPLVRLF